MVLPRSRVGLAIVALLVVTSTGCAEDDLATTAGASSTTTSTTSTASNLPPFEPPASGTLVRWYQTAGECQVCGYTLELDASGTATYVGFETESTVTFDADDLRARLDRIDEQALIVGVDDCGREVDGNAPVLELVTADDEIVIDDCYETIDRTHPVMELVLSALQEAEIAAGVE